ncbi:MAG: PEP-CTERM sorting domain-containing protein [Fimbriimonadaceae bacterium]
MKRTIFIVGAAALSLNAVAQYVSDPGLDIIQLIGDSSVTTDNVDAADLIQGQIAVERTGDPGWHTATPTGEENRLGAFTDGTRTPGGAGLLWDALDGDGERVPGPVKLLEYSFAVPANLSNIKVFSANDNPDIRAVHQYVVRWSTDGGQSFADDVLVRSADSGYINQGTGNTDVMSSIFSMEEGFFATGVTNIQFDFYATGEGEQMVDPYNGTNPFTGEDDGLGIPFVSPQIKEIDIVGQPVPEPATMLALGAGLAALAARRRRK